MSQLGHSMKSIKKPIIVPSEIKELTIIQSAPVLKSSIYVVLTDLGCPFEVACAGIETEESLFDFAQREKGVEYFDSLRCFTYDPTEEFQDPIVVVKKTTILEAIGTSCAYGLKGNLTISNKEGLMSVLIPSKKALKMVVV